MYYLIQCGTETIGTATNLDFCSYSEERGIMMLCPATMAQVISCAGGYYHDTWMAADPSQIGVLATVTPIHKDVYDLYNEQGELPDEPEEEEETEPETPIVTSELESVREMIKSRLLAERNAKLLSDLDFTFGTVPQSQEGLTAMVFAGILVKTSTSNPRILTNEGYVEISSTELMNVFETVNTFRQQVEEDYQALLKTVNSGSMEDIINLHLK